MAVLLGAVWDGKARAVLVSFHKPAAGRGDFTPVVPLRPQAFTLAITTCLQRASGAIDRQHDACSTCWLNPNQDRPARDGVLSAWWAAPITAKHVGGDTSGLLRCGVLMVS